MNRHLDEGTLQALLDGELPPRERAAADAHLAACAACAAGLRELRAALDTLSTLVARTDVAPPLALAQMSMRARRAAQLAATSRFADMRRTLLRAAALVLGVATVAAAAVPGSPVREAIERAVLPAQKTEAPEAMRPAAPAPAPAAPAEELAPSGLSIRPSGGTVRVVLSGAAPGLVVRTRLVDDPHAEVFASGPAAAGMRFRTAPGKIEVVNAGAGEVRVDLPRGATSAYVEVDGRVRVAKDGQALRLKAPPAPGSTAEAPAFRVGG